MLVVKAYGTVSLSPAGIAMPYCFVVKFRRIRDCNEEVASEVQREPPMN